MNTPLHHYIDLEAYEVVTQEAYDEKCRELEEAQSTIERLRRELHWTRTWIPTHARKAYRKRLAERKREDERNA